MQPISKKLSLIAIILSALSLNLTSPASAHVAVRPAEVAAATFQTFTIGVPNEKDIPTTGLKLLIPSGLEYVSPTQKAGWTIDIEENDQAAIASISWTGSQINVGLRDDFNFSAKVPAAVTELHWKAYQTYSDGTVVSWDQADEDSSHSGGNSGPFSATSVVSQTSTEAAIGKADQAAAEAKIGADRALYTAIAGIAVGLIGVFLTTRKAS